METLFPIYFSASMLGDVHRCDLYFFRKYCQHLNSLGKNSDLLAGGLFASACERTRKAYFNDGIGEEDAVDLGKELILTGQDTLSENKSNERLAFAFGKYFDKYPLNDSLVPCKLADGTHAIEYEFKLDLGIPHPEIAGQNIIFRGKLDGLYEKQHTNGEVKRYVLDEKTTGRVARLKGTKVVDLAAEEEGYIVDGQMCAYSYAARQLGVSIDGAMVNKVPILKEHEPAFRLIIDMPRWKVETWADSTFRKIFELVEKYKGWKEHCPGYPQQVFYPVYNSIGCKAYNKTCKYLDGCKSEHGEELLAMQFQQLVQDNVTKEFIPMHKYKKMVGLT